MQKYDNVLAYAHLNRLLEDYFVGTSDDESSSEEWAHIGNKNKLVANALTIDPTQDEKFSDSFLTYGLLNLSFGSKEWAKLFFLKGANKFDPLCLYHYILMVNSLSTFSEKDIMSCLQSYNPGLLSFIKAKLSNSNESEHYKNAGELGFEHGYILAGLLTEKNNPLKALQYYGRVVRGCSVSAYQKSGDLLLSLKRFDAALDAYRQLELAGDRYGAALQGKLLLELNRKDEAKEALERALPFAVPYLKKIQNNVDENKIYSEYYHEILRNALLECPEKFD